MDVADRVQIAPLGYEYNRILKPIYEYITQILSFYSVTKRSRTTKHRFSAISCRHSEKMIVSNSKNENAISSTSTAR